MSETTRALQHLARSREVRRLVLRETGKLFLAIVSGGSIAVAIRVWLEKPISADFVAELIIGMAAIGLFLLVSAVRTVRAVLRAHGLLQ